MAFRKRHRTGVAIRFAILHLLAGTHFKVVAEALGHSSVAITLDRYSHLIPTTQDEAAIRLDEFLGREKRAG